MDSQGAWEWSSRPTDQSAPGEPRPLGFLGNVYLLPLIPIPFFIPSGIPEEARTWLCQLKSDLGSNRQQRRLDHGIRRAGDTFPTFLQLPARPEARVLEPSGISAASELLSLPQHSGRGLKAAGLPHRASPNPTPGNQVIILLSVRKDIGAKDRVQRKDGFPEQRRLQGHSRNLEEELRADSN